VKHAVAVANGTAALHAACWAAGLGPGDEVITTPPTFAATANAVVYQGAQPVFADVDGATLNVSPNAVKRAPTSRTRALLPVDFAGLPCECDRLLPLTREHGWTVIADAAHSFGGASGGRRVGALADPTTLAVDPVKLITTGEGGAVLTDRDDLTERLRAMRHHGIGYVDVLRRAVRLRRGALPDRRRDGGRLVTRPLFPAMTEGDQDDVLHALDKVFTHYAR